MAGASALFILDSKGKVIISRNYRGDVPSNVVDRFSEFVIEQEEALVKPVFSLDGLIYCWVQHHDIYLVLVTVQNSNAMMLLSFLYRLVDVLRSYFKVLKQESLRDNFVVTYELLDEVMDNGFPQITEGKVLREFIKNEAYQLSLFESGKPKLPPCATTAVSWRSEGIKHKKNEIYLDVIEKINLLVSSTGTVVHSEILGSLKLKSYLSGMPHLKLGLNDKLQFEAANGRGGEGSVGSTRAGMPHKVVDLEDVRFHQCVRLSRFESTRTISFIPPDGEFVLMSYRILTPVKPLFWIECNVSDPAPGRSRVECVVKLPVETPPTLARTNFPARCVATDVEIHIPVPPDTDTPAFKTPNGRVKYLPDKNEIVWYIKHFPGHKELTMAASFGMPTTAAGDPRAAMKRPISVVFELPYYTVSAVTVQSLQIVEKSGYQALPWVRYITRNGDYLLRMS